MSRYAAAAAAAAPAPSASFTGNDLFANEAVPPPLATPSIGNAMTGGAADSRDALLDRQRALAQEKARQRMSMSLTVGGGADPLLSGANSLGTPSYGLGGGALTNGGLMLGGGGLGGPMVNGGLLSGTSAGRSSLAGRGAPMTMAPGSLTGGLGGGGAGSFSLLSGGPLTSPAGGAGGFTSPSAASSVTVSATNTAATNSLLPPTAGPAVTGSSSAATSSSSSTAAGAGADSAIGDALKEREKRSVAASSTSSSQHHPETHFGEEAVGSGGASPGNKQQYAPVQPIVMMGGPSAAFGMTGGGATSASAGSGDDAVTGLAALDLSDLRRFLSSPVPKAAGVIQCHIERDKGGLTGKWYPSYYLYLSIKHTAENNAANGLGAGLAGGPKAGIKGGALPKGVTSTADIFLLASKKRANNKTSNYLISMDKRDLNRDSDSFLGKVRSNYFGTEFVVYDDGLAPSDAAAAAAAATKKGLKSGNGREIQRTALRQEIASILYASNVLASRGPRRMKIVVPRVMPDGRAVSFQPETDDAEGLSEALKSNHMRDIVLMVNKQPKWNDQVGAYVLNFNGRVTMASVKNFQLVTSEDEETVVLQFGRVDKDLFTMDLQWPLSPLQAFAITLSSFDYKLACE